MKEGIHFQELQGLFLKDCPFLVLAPSMPVLVIKTDFTQSNSIHQFYSTILNSVCLAELFQHFQREFLLKIIRGFSISRFRIFKILPLKKVP